jgi:small subunit ribosomal protein S6e
MTFKINIGEKTGKTYKLEIEGDSLIGKEIHSKIDGKLVSPNLEGYEFEITGISDKSGFTALKDVEGVGLKKVFLTYGKGMRTRPKREGKWARSDKTPKGFKLRKTVRGKVISENIAQINLKILKEGTKKLSELFTEQGNKEQKTNRKERRKNKLKEEVKVEDREETSEGKIENMELARPDEEPKGEVPKEEMEEAKE